MFNKISELRICEIMCSKYFILFTFVFMAYATCFSQETEQIKKENYFYIGPIDLFLNTIQLSYERKLHNHNTFCLMGGFKLSKKDETINRLGGNGEFQYRINLLYNKEAVSSVVYKYSSFAYFAPFLQYRYEEITDVISFAPAPVETIRTYVNSYFGGMGFGLRISAMENRFSMNLFAGGGLKYSNVYGQRKYDAFTEIGYTGISPKIGFQMGIAF